MPTEIAILESPCLILEVMWNIIWDWGVSKFRLWSVMLRRIGEFCCLVGEKEMLLFFWGGRSVC